MIAPRIRPGLRATYPKMDFYHRVSWFGWQLFHQRLQWLDPMEIGTHLRYNLLTVLTQFCEV